MQRRLGRRPSPLILCVDDDPTARMVAQLAMVSAGHDVVEAETGAAALAAFETHRPDLVLLDIHIGDMSGFQVCERIRSTPHGANLPIVMLTGDEQSDTIRRAYDVGATDFESKDVPAPVLSQRVQFLLRAKATLDALQESELRIEVAQRLARVGSWEWDTETDRHTWSTMTCELLGHDHRSRRPTHEDFLGNIAPDDVSRVEHALRSFRDRTDGPPVEFRVSSGDDELILQLRAESVYDPAGQLLGVAGSLQDITAIRRAEHRIRELAYYDSVTGLPNRTLFLEQLRTGIADAGRRGTHAGIIFLDLDHFKTVNDTLGHAAGDQVLKAAANRLRLATRASDPVSRLEETATEEWSLGRLGGDEFVVLLRDVRRDDDAGVAAARLLRSLEAPFEIEDREVFLTASAGIALYPTDALDADTLLRNADTAMYAAKETGRNAFRFFDATLNETVAHRLDLESGLRRAVDRLEFRLYYQPIVDSVSGHIVGGECLIRWQHPVRGLIFPGQFIPVAEESGLITLVSAWVISTACTQHKAWTNLGHVVPLAFNVSSRDFQTREFADLLQQTVTAAGVDPRVLTIEITEGVLLRQSEIAIENLNRLKALGFRLSIDDFGTGYSSLSYLRRFPVNQIKVDRSFIRDIESDHEAVAITEAVALISNRLGIEAVAEGVERRSQREIPSGLGFGKMQGFLFGKAVPADEFLALLESGRRAGSRGLFGI